MRDVIYARPPSEIWPLDVSMKDRTSSRHTFEQRPPVNNNHILMSRRWSLYTSLTVTPFIICTIILWLYSLRKLVSEMKLTSECFNEWLNFVLPGSWFPLFFPFVTSLAWISSLLNFSGISASGPFPLFSSHATSISKFSVSIFCFKTLISRHQNNQHI